MGLERLAADALGGYLDADAPRGHATSVRLDVEFQWNEYRVHLDGRVDVMATAGRGAARGQIVEVMRCVPAAGGAERSVERVGLLCLLLEMTGQRVHVGRVVELSLVGAATDSVDVAYSTEACRALLDARLQKIERTCLGGRKRSRTQQALGEELAFPFDEIRPGQDLMARDIDGVVENGLTLLCSAPTGIGKTAAVLHPMLRRALLEDRKLFFVTSKVSQQTLALDTLRRMLRPGRGGFAVQISARERVCPTEDLGCLPGKCPLQRQYPERLQESGLLEEISDCGVADSQLIRDRALANQLCPLEVSLDLSLFASAIVCDFNYVFHPNVYLRRFFDESYAHHLLVVDEAHNLPSRAQDFYSPVLELNALAGLAGRCEVLPAPVYRSLARLLREIVSHCTRFAETLAAVRGDDAPWVEAPDREFWESIGMQAASASAAYPAPIAMDGRPAALSPDPKRAGGQDPVRAALGTIRNFCHFSEGDPERTATLWTPDSAKLLCMDPAPALGERIRGFHAAVCMSATLHPADFYASALGIDAPETVRLGLPSPFPPENRLMLTVPSVDTTYRKRDEDAPRVAELISRCMEARPGNYLAFFPSFAYRDEVIQHLPPRSARILVQIPGIPTAPFLKQLERNTQETLLLCAVHGGVFSEGVDYPDHMAIGVFVVGPGLPLVSLERELIREYHENRIGQGFEHAYVAPGMNRVVQAGGRAIRTPTDRAPIVLLGKRFSDPVYRQRMPGWWQDELIEADDPVPLLKAFWERGSQGRTRE